ncbi:hypothetical protein NQ317_009488 [Molorchus minor]|uniref:Uncharacterized protein n=1 Tax=Molorchus minor TaxID=1323400 RepID=A0ABQ9JK14_9CUCU|nr:hypothetical protein NQ317_009488 [Molorchus minor]
MKICIPVGVIPNNPCNPIPILPPTEKFTYFKLGLEVVHLCGAMVEGQSVYLHPNTATKPDEKTMISETSGVSSPIPKIKKESHLSKVSILKRKSPAKTNLQSLAVSKVGSLVSTDYNEFDDSSSTPPVTPPPLVASNNKGSIPKNFSQKILEQQEIKDSVMVMHSPDEKRLNVNDIMDYDDDNNTVLSAEVSLSSAAQTNDAEDMVEIETLSQPDLAEGLSSPLESDQIPDEYLLFPGNMVVGEEEAEGEYSEENMHIVIRSPTTSDDEFIMQGTTKKYNIVPHPDQLLNMADTLDDSPEQDEINIDPSPEPADEEILESEILIIDPAAKSPEDSISTKEDFEELIDEGSRKDNLKKQEVNNPKQINDFHKYTNIFNYTKNIQPSASQATASIPTTRVTNVVTQKLPQKNIINHKSFSTQFSNELKG